MCGIVGYVGTKDAKAFLLSGLQALEYRGYDSAGLYICGAGAVKRAGKVAKLAAAVPEHFSGNAGIAHTRWATHGAPTELNAHPHTDASGTVWLVHNGIIENYRELQRALAQAGTAFATETDSEVLAALIAHFHETRPLEEAVRAALERVRGTYGLAVMSVKEPETIVAARLGSPLLIGVGKNSYFLASDASPVLPHTRAVIYLEDGDLAVLTREGYRMERVGGGAARRPVEHLAWSVEAAQKQGHEHFMLKEMLETPEVLGNALRGRLKNDGMIMLGGLEDVRARLDRARRIVITACGSASYAGQVGARMIEDLAGIPVEVVLASELRYRRFLLDAKDTVLIAVSQSGETLDTLEAVREAKRHGVLTLGIVNVVGSTIARETDAGVYNHAGPEISVASTKAFLSQIAILAEIALMLGRAQHTKDGVTGEARGLTEAKARAFARELSRLPELARITLEKRAEVAALAEKYAGARDAFYIGRGYQCPVAYEGAIKLKEIAYVHAEGYAAGEMKHGPIALLDTDFLTVALAPGDALYEKMRSNMREAKARASRLIAVTTEDRADELAALADDVIAVPKTHEALQAVLTTIPLQLFAYYVAKARGCPIDQPRNLAKSVTVE